MIIFSLSFFIIQYFISLNVLFGENLLHVNFYCQFELKLDLFSDDTINKHSAILQLLHQPLNG